MNDPNGLLFVDGELHVTYQHNPDEPRWGRMHWGHASSRDLVTWRQLPIALSPDPSGPAGAGCWSGSIVAVGDNPQASPALAFYTGVTMDGELRRQVVCRAATDDLRSGQWRPDPTTPVIDEPPDGIMPDLFRDPFVCSWGRRWMMLIGAGTADGHGAVLRYFSRDLVSWTFDRTILASDQLDPASGADGPMWECPQLLRTVDGDVLVVSVVDRAPGIRPSHVTAFVGRLGEAGFAVAHVQQLGMGPDFYAPAACRTPDGRSMLLGWIPEDPPEAGSDRDWAGALTFPRVVSVVDGGRISLSLAAEVARARGPRVEMAGVLLKPEDQPVRPKLPPGPFEVRFELEPLADAEAVIELRDDDASPLARVMWRASRRLLTVARREIVSVAGRSAVSSVELPESDGPMASIRMLVDGSILELETNGHTMATARLSPRVATNRSVVLLAVNGPVRVTGIDVWPLIGPDAPGARDGRPNGGW